MDPKIHSKVYWVNCILNHCHWAVTTLLCLIFSLHLFTLFYFRMIVLITIRRGLLKLEKKIKKIIFLMSMSPAQSKHSTLEKNNVSEKPMEDFFSLSALFNIQFYRYPIRMVTVWNTSHRWTICHSIQRQCRQIFVVESFILTARECWKSERMEISD